MSILPYRSRWLFVWIACALALWLFSTMRVTAQTPTPQGAIEGRAALASADSTASLNALPVSLFTFINGVRQVPPTVGQTDGQGRVRFAQLATSANYTYTLFIKFQDTIFRSDPIAFAPNSNAAAATVVVYDSADDTHALRVDQHHVIVDVASDSQSLNIVELYVLTNTGDRTIAGVPDSAANGKRVSFRAPLPPDAVIDSIEERTPSEDIFQSGNQLLDTVPIAPGAASLAFAYRLPFQRSTVALAVGSPYTTTALNVLVAPGIGVRSPRLAPQGTVAAGSRQFQHYSARDVSAGATVAIELSGLPAPLIPIDVLQWLPLVVAGGALMVTLFIASRRKTI